MYGEIIIKLGLQSHSQELYNFKGGKVIIEVYYLGWNISYAVVFKMCHYYSKQTLLQTGWEIAQSTFFSADDDNQCYQYMNWEKNLHKLDLCPFYPDLLCYFYFFLLCDMTHDTTIKHPLQWEGDVQQVAANVWHPLPSLSLPGSGSRCQNSGSECQSQLRPGLAVRPRSRSQLARVFRYVNTREVRPCWVQWQDLNNTATTDKTPDRASTNNFAKKRDKAAVHLKIKK